MNKKITQFRWLAAMLMLVAAMVMPSTVWAQTMYTVFDTATGTLTFKFDSSKPSDTKYVYDVPTNSDMPGWMIPHSLDIKKVVFDASFVDARPTKCFCWFNGCSQLTAIQGLEYLNTSEVTDMGSMFNNCSSLTFLDLSCFDTQNVFYMGAMFRGCNNLQTIFVSDKFVTTKVNSSYDMFLGCTSLEGGVAYSSEKTNDATFANCTTGYFTHVINKVDYGFHAVYNSSSQRLTFKYGKKTKLDTEGTAYELNTGKTAPGWINNTGITKVVFEMSFANALPTSCFQWFNGLSSLTTIEGIGYLNTSEVTDMNEMFSGCSSLSTLQLKTFNTAKVTDMAKMFYNCSALISIYTSDLFVVSAVSASEEMFTGCTSLVGAITYDEGKVTKDYANNETGYFMPKPKGEGTSKSPYLISNAADLDWFRDHVNQCSRTACARLEADIDMSSVCHAADESEGVAELSWVPISYKSIVGSNYWYGTFDGNNKTISNLYINTSAEYSGLFGYIYNENASERGSVKNLKFENVSVTSTADKLGVLAGYARNTDISGITVNSGTVNGTENCGGIVGYTEDSSISVCINKINIVGGSSWGKNNIGGIVGYEKSGSITNCANYGNVKGYSRVGGIAGVVGGTIENVFSSGDVTCIETSPSWASTGLVVGNIVSGASMSGHVIYKSEAKLSYGTTAQATRAFGEISSYSTVTESDATGMTKEQLATGQAAYLLNGSSPAGAWGQTLSGTGKQDYPVLGGMPVYYRAEVYANTYGILTEGTQTITASSSPNVWYEFTPTETGIYRFSSTDIEGSICVNTEMTSNETQNMTTSPTYSLTAETTYYVYVDYAPGEYKLTITKLSTTTALEAVVVPQIYAVDGRIVCEGEFRIYDLLGRDVTRLNGSLCGVYVAKIGEAAVKVVVK